MKKGEQPEVSSKWWKSSQPKGLKSAGKLEDALKDYEAAKKKLEAGGDADAAKAAKAALGAVESAVDSVSTEAGKDKKNPEMGFTVDAMKKFERLYSAEADWIEEHAEQDDDSVFGDPDAYHQYLIGAMKKLRGGGQMNFGFVLGKKAEDHRLAVHRSKGSKALANVLVKETGLHAMTFGTAMADENRAGTLLLILEGRQLPGMAKKGARMLKKFKPLPFTKLAVFVDGDEVQDLDDPDDADIDEPDGDAEQPAATTAAEGPDLGALGRELADLIRAVQGVSDPTAKQQLAQMATDARAALKEGDQPHVVAGLASLREGLQAAPNGGANAQSGNGNGAARVYAKSRAAWVATRQKIETDIGKLHDQVSSVYQDHGVADDLEKAFQTHVERMLSSLDISLAEKLDEVGAAGDPAQHAQLVAEAKQIIQRYEDYVSSEPIITAIDTNPFVPMAIQRTVTTTLSVLSKALV